MLRGLIKLSLVCLSISLTLLVLEFVFPNRAESYVVNVILLFAMAAVFFSILFSDLLLLDEYLFKLYKKEPFFVEGNRVVARVELYEDNEKKIHGIAVVLKNGAYFLWHYSEILDDSGGTANIVLEKVATAATLSMYKLLLNDFPINQINTTG